MKKVLLVLIMLVLAFTVAAREEYKIIDVLSGNKVLVTNGESEKEIYIYGIYAPKEGEYFYEESKEALEMFLDHYNVDSGVVDPSTRENLRISDKVMRAMSAVGYVKIGGTLWMTREEMLAKDKKFGIWSNQ